MEHRTKVRYSFIIVVWMYRLKMRLLSKSSFSNQFLHSFQMLDLSPDEALFSLPCRPSQTKMTNLLTFPCPNAMSGMTVVPSSCTIARSFQSDQIGKSTERRSQHDGICPELRWSTNMNIRTPACKSCKLDGKEVRISDLSGVEVEVQ